MWFFLYVIQFLLMPLIARDFWVSSFVGNSLYLLAFGYYAVITFLGYNGKSQTCPIKSRGADQYPALPFLHHTELLLTPVAVFTILWFISLFGANLPKHLAPVLWAGAKLRKSV